MTTGPSSRREQRNGTTSQADAAFGSRLLLPLTGSVLAIVALTLTCRQVMGSAAARGDGHGSWALYALAAAVLITVVTAGALHARRLAERFAGPEARLIESLRRMRTGDLAFRVHLRRGDPLTGLADECNALLDWLNRNPPSQASTGSDVVDVERMELEAPEATT